MNIEVTAQLFRWDGRPAASFPVALELCSPNGGWRQLAVGKTDPRDGTLRLGETLRPPVPAIPALRLVHGESRAESAQVLAQIGSFKTGRSTASVAFGPLILLPDGGVPLPGTEEQGRLESRAPGERLVAIPDVLAKWARREFESSERGDPDETDRPGSRSLEALRELLTVETAQADQLRVRIKHREGTIEDLEEERAVLRSELSEAREALEILQKSEESSPTVDSLAGAISGALNQARSLGGLELSNAEIRLRGIVSEAGSRFHPLDAAEARTIRPENVSELTLRLTSPKPREALPDQVPDVIGRTVNSARRKALAVGLDLEVIEEVAPDRPAGAIISQAPEPGQPAAAGRGALSVVVAVPRSTDQETP